MLWSVIENILLIINKLWRQQHGRAVKRGYWSNWWFELVRSPSHLEETKATTTDKSRK